jgi:hypothetical protein
MTIQRSVAARDAANNAYSTTLGTTSVTLLLFTGAPPATCATADSGTVLATLALPSTPLGSSSSGVIGKSGSAWTGTASATGTAGYYRLKASGGAVVEQGTVAIATTVNTSALTAAHGNVLTFASAPAGVVVGQTIAGTGVAAGCLVESISGATIIMSKTSTAGVASAAAITFSADLALDNTSIATSQTVTIASYAITAGDA